jgi:hypothetical protein
LQTHCDSFSRRQPAPASAARRHCHLPLQLGSATANVERDADSNTYQNRRFRDGSVHRVDKNFPSETELRQMVADAAKAASYKALENFWLFEYALANDRITP